MPTRDIQVHYVLYVPMTVEVDDAGETVAIVATGQPVIDIESNAGPDETDVWDPYAEEWRTLRDAEWETGAHILDQALRARKALVAIHAVMDGRDCGSDELGDIANIVWEAVGPLRSAEEALADE